jgi:hypothetical protein
VLRPGPWPATTTRAGTTSPEAQTLPQEILSNLHKATGNFDPIRPCWPAMRRWWTMAVPVQEFEPAVWTPPTGSAPLKKNDCRSCSSGYRSMFRVCANHRI